MTAETFEQEMRNNLRALMIRYPAMEQQDVVKFVFQAMLGVGHLLSSREAVQGFIERETEGLAADSEEPLTEGLSPDWCRINLRRAMAEGIGPSALAGLMLASEGTMRFSRQDVYDFCVKLAAEGESRLTGMDSPETILDETWLPSHSPAYRERYHPAYRVISADWIPRMEAVSAIAKKQSEPGKDRILVAIDGPCASGKTTLAEKLADVFSASVVHTDDYVIPHAQKTPERLAIPGGNCDADRIIREVAAPWKQGRTVRYRRYDCKADRLLPEEELPEGRLLILEGSYSHLPEIRKYADISIFVRASFEERMARLQRRESAWSLQMFQERWIPLEDAYFSAYGLPDGDCILLRA